MSAVISWWASAHNSPSAVNIGGLEDLQRTQCQLTPRLLFVAHSHCMQRAENPPLLQPMRGAHILTHRILKIEGNVWYEVGLPNLSTSNVSLSKIILGSYMNANQCVALQSGAPVDAHGWPEHSEDTHDIETHM